jgi:hypothetical protein
MMIAMIARTEVITPKMMVPVKSELGSEVFAVVDVALWKAARVILELASGCERDEMVRLEVSGAIVWTVVEREFLLWSKCCCCCC